MGDLHLGSSVLPIARLAEQADDLFVGGHGMGRSEMSERCSEPFAGLATILELRPGAGQSTPFRTVSRAIAPRAPFNGGGGLSGALSPFVRAVASVSPPPQDPEHKGFGSVMGTRAARQLQPIADGVSLKWKRGACGVRRENSAPLI